jgi:DNA helicase-2/ATP-dependent DNA helicase PcrA
MQKAEIDLLGINKGTVTAPAGCGKTQLIADALRAYQDSKPILILTHTNAGVASLRGRLERAEVPPQRYRLHTIDGWSIRMISTFPERSGHNPSILRLANARTDYPSIRAAISKLIQKGHINEVLQASYARLIVDEYQDCSIAQHEIVCGLSAVLPTCVLGDPLQAIFGFNGNPLVDWKDQVCVQFPLVGELQTPWRWINSGNEELGQWLLQARKILIAGQKVDLRTAPAQVTWVQLTGSDHSLRRSAAMTNVPGPNSRVLIIAESTSPDGQRQIASQTPGAVTVEAADLKDLSAFARIFDLTSVNALAQLLEFAQKLMVNLDLPSFNKRLDSISNGSARKPATLNESQAIHFKHNPAYATAADLLQSLRQQPKVRVYRPEILSCAIRALRLANTGDRTLEMAATQICDENRSLGRLLPRRAVGSTLLLKGLEAEGAVILNGDNLNAANLYVAMTRGSMKLVVCSQSPTLG